MRDLSAGVTIWFTGLPSSGKTTLAHALAKRLADEGYDRVEVLDGDLAREHLTKGLGFSREDRAENVRRIGWVASLLARNGVIVLASVISPYRDDRDAVREMHGERFVEVHVATPLEDCVERDSAGLYASAARAALPGVGVEYEAPPAAEVTAAGGKDFAAADRVVALVEKEQRP